jgi:bifunctional non-homologous end joining protein LigD
LIIGCYTLPQGTRNQFGSLYLGYYDNHDNLQYCGKVGTGFNEKSLKSIYKKLKNLETNDNPFSVNPPGVTTAVWVKPKLVAEIEFTEWTKGKALRHPSFKGLRHDKSPKNITIESHVQLSKIKPSIIKVKKSVPLENKIQLPIKLTHPDKILYPESKITKLDLAQYYDHIQEWILPYLVNRPLTIVRCPENYKECFYQKHINQSTPKTLYGVKIKEKNKVAHCIYIKDSKGLLSLIQMGTLEIHPWGSRIETIEYPDTITFDLDPAPQVEWKEVVKTAKRLQKHLLEFNLTSFVKTTGGKGLHVVIPIKPQHHWDEIKNFTHIFVQFMVERYPNEYVGQMSKVKRKGKIFIDYLRNLRGATAISAYSTRARFGAPVSVPLAWDELTNHFKDTSFNIFNLPKRLNELKNDPWELFFKLNQSLNLYRFK